MIVMIMFELDSKIARKISLQDMHAEDILDEINDAAIQENNRLEIWHLGNRDQLPVAKLVSDYCEKTKMPKPTQRALSKPMWS